MLSSEAVLLVSNGSAPKEADSVFSLPFFLALRILSVDGEVERGLKAQ